MLRRAAYFVFFAAVFVFWAKRVRVFLAVVPGHDFVGDTYWVDYFYRELGAGHLPSWTRLDGFGHPTTVQRGSLLLFLPVVLLKTVVTDTLLAAKLWFAALHTLSAVTMYGLARRYVPSRADACIAASVYLICPPHLQELTTEGHWQLALSFCLMPWVLAKLVDAIRMPVLAAGAALGGLSACWLLADNERAVTGLVLILAVALFELRAKASGRERLRAVRALGGALGLTFLLSAGFTVPLLAEHASINLLREVDGAPFRLFAHHAIETFHPFFLLDRGAWLYVASGSPPPLATGFHVGWALAIAAIALTARAVMKDAGPVLGRLGLPIAATLTAVAWCATGASWWRSSFAIVRSAPFEGGLTLAVVLIATAFVFVLGRLRRRWSWRAIAGGVLCAGLVVALPSRAVLGALPVLSLASNHYWFAVVNLPIVMSLAVGLVAYEARGAGPGWRWVVALGLPLFVSMDAFDAYQLRRDAGLADEAAATLAPINADATDVRYLTYPYVESDPLEAFTLRYSSKPSASSWLLWTCSRSGVRAVTRAYGDLSAFDAAVRAQVLPSSELEARAGAVLDWLADAGIRYLVIRWKTEGVTWLVDHGFLTTVSEPREPGAAAGVLRNERWRGGRMVTRFDAPEGRVAVGYRRVSDEAFEIVADAPGVYRVAEAWYPHWRVAGRGADRDTRASSDGFIEFDVTEADVGGMTLRFEEPKYYAWLLAVSAATAMALLVAVAAGAVGVFVRAQRARARGDV